MWRQGLPQAVIASPDLDGAGVLAVGTFSQGHLICPSCASYLLDASNGHVLTTLTSGASVSGQLVFADGLVYVTAAFGSEQGSYAFGP
jgi:hypothetical protein